MKWYIIAIFGFIVVFYILTVVRQKRQTKKQEEALEAFKVGDKVVTHIGVYGKIKKIYNTSFGKTCLLEVGKNEKIELEMDMRYIAALDEKVLVADEVKVEEPKEQEPKEQEVKQEQKTETENLDKTKNQKKNKKQK